MVKRFMLEHVRRRGDEARLALGGVDDVAPWGRLLESVASVAGIPAADVPADVVRTRLGDLDDVLGGGLHRGQLMIVGSPPDECATDLVLHLAREAAMRSHVSSWVVMSGYAPEALVRRMLAAEARVSVAGMSPPVDRLLNIDRIRDAVCIARNAPLYVHDPGTWSVQQLCRAVRRAPGHKRPQVLVAGKLQAFAMNSSGSYEDALVEAATELQHLARDLSIAVIATSELRDWDKIKIPDCPPSVDMIAGPGQIKRVADTVLIPYREESCRATTRAGEVDLCVLKNLHGPTAKLVLIYQEHLARFSRVGS